MVDRFTSEGTRTVAEYAETNAGALVAELAEWCSIPSISTDPAHTADVQRSAEHLAGLMERAGLDTEILSVPGGQPAVYGAWLGAGPRQPTVTVYGHHDVQPVDPLDAWVTAPFDPTVRDGCLYARGASDDKGQVHLQVAALRHLLRVDGRLPVNVKLLVEGEEEAGSPTIDAFLGSYADRLACDLVCVSDTGMYSVDQPSLVTSMRGLAYFQIDLRTAPADLHSGVFGGTVPNAAAALVELLGKLTDGRGRIAVPGWYDDVVGLTDADRRQFAQLDFDPDAYMRTANVTALPGEDGYSPLERTGARPSVDVNGIWSGYTGVGEKTIIPAEAHAKVSFRLVAEQDPATLRPLLERWAAESAPVGAEVSVTYRSGVRPCRTPLDHPGNHAARAAVARAFGGEPLFTHEGGSGPERSLSDALDASCVYLGVMLPEDNLHAPNERLLLSHHRKGIAAAAYAYEEFARPQVAAALRAVTPPVG